jgi:hypothetical protein
MIGAASHCFGVASYGSGAVSMGRDQAGEGTGRATAGFCSHQVIWGKGPDRLGAEWTYGFGGGWRLLAAIYGAEMVLAMVIVHIIGMYRTSYGVVLHCGAGITWQYMVCLKCLWSMDFTFCKWHRALPYSVCATVYIPTHHQQLFSIADGISFLIPRPPHLQSECTNNIL